MAAGKKIGVVRILRGVILKMKKPCAERRHGSVLCSLRRNYPHQVQRVRAFARLSQPAPLRWILAEHRARRRRVKVPDFTAASHFLNHGGSQRMHGGITEALRFFANASVFLCGSMPAFHKSGHH